MLKKWLIDLLSITIILQSVAVSADIELDHFSQPEHHELSHTKDKTKIDGVVQQPLNDNVDDYQCFLHCHCHCATQFFSLDSNFVSNETLQVFKINVADYITSINTVFYSPSLRPPIA